jgi:UDP-glucose 4-epimerase
VDRKKVALITGIAGGLARLTAAALYQQGFQIVGVDYRPVARALDHPSHLYQANYNKTKIEDIFRRHPPTHVLHLGRVGNLKQQINKRFDLNVLGSRKVMDLGLRYGAERMVVLSTFHIYGAHPHNHIPIFEDEPLRAGADFPQLADAIQLDNQAISWMYQHQDCPVAVLRPTNVIGPDIENAISTVLRGPRVPVMMGFDPMTQFIHQDDLVSALVAVAQGKAIGVYNVAGDGELPWRRSVETVGSKELPIPSTIASGYLRVAGLFKQMLPPYLLNFLKYPCVISNHALKGTFGWRSRVSIQDGLRSLR